MYREFKIRQIIYVRKEGRHGITLEDRKQYSEIGLKMTFQPVDLLRGP